MSWMTRGSTGMIIALITMNKVDSQGMDMGFLLESELSFRTVEGQHYESEIFRTCGVLCQKS